MGLGRFAGILICRIKFTVVILSFFIMASCSYEKDQMDGNEGKGENIASIAEKNTEADSVFNQIDEDYYFSEIEDYIFTIDFPLITERVELFAGVKEDNVHIYSSLDNRRSGYLHRGNVIKISSRTAERIMVNNVFDYFYYFQILPNISGLINSSGWIHGQFLNIINIPTDNITALTNAQRVNHEGFPGRMAYSTEYSALHSPPSFLEDFNDWILITHPWPYSGRNDYTIRLHNLPDEFYFLIYANDRNNPFRFIPDKIEYPIEIFNDFPYTEDRNIVNRLQPLYIFSLQMPISANAGIHRTEIRSRYYELLFSANLNYVDMPFRMHQLNQRNFYLLYRSKTPFYLVIYVTIELDIDRIPVAAFAIYPNDDIWNGLLTLGTELQRGYDYSVYFYHINPQNPKDYSRLVEERSWANNFGRVNY